MKEPVRNRSILLCIEPICYFGWGQNSALLEEGSWRQTSNKAMGKVSYSLVFAAVAEILFDPHILLVIQQLKRVRPDMDWTELLRYLNMLLLSVYLLYTWLTDVPFLRAIIAIYLTLLPPEPDIAQWPSDKR